MNAELTTFVVSMLPLLELRLGLPIGVQMGLEPHIAAIWALLGNFTAVVVIVYLLPLFVNLVGRHWAWFYTIILKIFAKTQKKSAGKVAKWKDWALFLFVAIPIPGTGGWTGALVAYLFGFPPKKALRDLFLGLLVADLIVLGIVGGFRLLF